MIDLPDSALMARVIFADCMDNAIWHKRGGPDWTAWRALADTALSWAEAETRRETARQEAAQ